MFRLRCILVVLFALLALNAHAYELRAGVVGATGSVEYKEYKTPWIAVPVVFFDSRYFFFSPPSTGFHIVKNEFFTLSAEVSYLPYEFKPHYSRNHALNKLDRRKSLFGAGMSASFKTKAGIFSTDFTSDILDRSDSLLISVSYTYPVRIGMRFITMPSIGFSFHDSNHNNYYYGVSYEEASRSGLEQYYAGSGVNIRLRLNNIYYITRELCVNFAVSASILSEEIANSPMVGQGYNWGLFVGVIYSF